MNNNKKTGIVYLWLLTSCFLVFIMVFIGGLTRLTNSGLSMVDWRPIMGTIPPLSSRAWIEAFNDYKATPEFQIVNKFISLSEFKFIFWWEWFHRFFARCIGIVFIIPFLWFLIKKRISKKLFIYLVLIFIFGLFQAIVGWWMVKSGLVDNPYVSPYRLTFHLFNAIIIFSLLFWNSLNLFYDQNINRASQNYSTNLIFISLILLFITIISGGFMAGSHAGNSFNTFPLSGNTP